MPNAWVCGPRGNLAGAMRRLAVTLVLATFVATSIAVTTPQPASANEAPIWCEPDAPGSDGQPVAPRPTWGELAGAPDYTNVADHIKINKTITLLVSVIEKGIQKLSGAGSWASMPDVDGYCLCNCLGDPSKDAQYWLNLIGTTLKTAVRKALEDTLNFYVDGLVARLEHGLEVLSTTWPNFQNDVRQILLQACTDLLGGCSQADLEALPQKLAAELGEVVKGELEAIFGDEAAEIEALLLGMGNAVNNGMSEVQQEARELLDFLNMVAQSDLLDLDKWLDFIKTKLWKAVVKALKDAKDAYVTTMLAHLNDVRDVLVNTLPQFRDDVLLLVESVCDDLPLGCPKTPEAASQAMQALLQEIADAAMAEVTSIFEAEKAQVLNALTGADGPVTKGMEAIQVEIDGLIAQFSSFDAIRNLKWSQVKQSVQAIFGEVKAAVVAIADKTKAIAQTYTKNDLTSWINQVAGAVEAKIAEKFANAPEVIAALETGLKAAVQARIEAIKSSLDQLFEAATDYQAVIDVFLASLLQSVLAELGDLGQLNPKAIKAKVENILQTTQDTLAFLTDSSKALVTLVQGVAAGDLEAWRNQVLAAAEAWALAKYTNGQQVFDQVKADLQAAVDARIEAIVLAAQDLVGFATNHEAVLNNFTTSLTQNLLAGLEQLDGCFGITKRGECSVAAGGFCEGSPPGKIAGQDTPIWFPTEIFKDGKTALLFALEKLGFLDKIRDFLETNAPTWMLQAGKLVDALKNAQEVIARIMNYVNEFTEGYHLGAYGNVRPDLHMCVGYAGHGAFAKVFSFEVGSFTIEGGSKYWSHNLSKKHRVQFRSGGFALAVNGKSVPLLPGVSLNTQIDGFRLWDKQYPFGLGRNSDGSLWNAVGSWSLNTANTNKYDAFNLVDQSELEKMCCASGQNPPCGSCNLTPASFFTDGFFPVDYTTAGMEWQWPRDSVEWEQDARSTAVFGAGLNLDLQMKTYKYEVSPPIILFTGVTLVPFLKLDAGIKWLYAANSLRTTLQDQLNSSLPAGEQLTAADFNRNMHKFQAPDATEEVGTGAFVAPEVGADLVLGIKLGKLLEIGITASLSVGVNVAIRGMGGVLDLNRALVDTLSQSNPDGDDCKPVIQETITNTCSNEVFKLNAACAGEPDCIDATAPKPSGFVPSTQTYACGDGEASGDPCEERGYCRGPSGKIVLHDITREQCETFEPGRCEAQVVTFGTVYHYEPTIQEPNATFGIAGFLPEWLEWNMSQAQAAAGLINSSAECTSTGHCQGLSYQGPGTIWDSLKPEPAFVYPTMYLGTATSASQCPYGTGPNGQSLNGLTSPATFVPFKWIAEGDPSGVPGGTYFPYQCVGKPKTEVVGWEGPDCHPLAFGFPSACGCIDALDCTGNCNNKKCSEATSGCACNPQQGGQCPAGRVCVDGGCLKTCSSSAECGPSRICEAGGCVMANGVPYAEQAIWRARNVSEPLHSIATHAYNDLVVSAFVGLGVRVGLRYRLFKKWREKNLVNLTKSIPILTKTFIKFELGLEAQYQGDCEPEVGNVINHQPGNVPRYAGGGSVQNLLDWCMPAAQNDVQNPAVPDPEEVILTNGLEGVHDFGVDLGLDLWAKNQLCIDGVPWYDYFALLDADPSTLWGSLECTYGPPAQLHDLNCDGPAELQASAVTAVGCLNVDGAPGALGFFSKNLSLLLGQSGQLGAFTKVYTPMHNGVATGPARLVFDMAALLLDPEEMFTKANLHPAILAQHGKSAGLGLFFLVDPWLELLDQCTDDHPVGLMREEWLEIVFPLDDGDFEVCEKACEPVASAPEVSPCAGVFGDVNGSGAANVADVQCSILAALWSLSGGALALPSCLAPPGLSSADLNCDGLVDVTDVVLDTSVVLGYSLPLALDSDTNGCPDRCEATCGDCMCAATENCASCPFDCGACGGQAAAGACCLPSGACTSATAGVCGAQGGAFLGEGQSCGGQGFCAQLAPGACCTTSGCAHMSSVQCAATGGAHKGAFTSCTAPGICNP